MRGEVVVEQHKKFNKKQFLKNFGIKKRANKKIRNEQINKAVMFVLTSFALFFFIFTIGFIVIRGINAFNSVPGLNWLYFLTGNYYAPNSGFFPGALMMVNSIWATFLTIIIAVPVSVMTALFITRIAPKSMRGILFSIIALLAAVPSVIYGAFGSNIINTVVYNWSGATGPLISIVFTLSLMIIPTITLITVASINSVDKKMEMSSLALGATKTQTTRNVTLKAITSGILTGTILGVGRALGEASAVSIVAGESNYMPSIGLFENIRLITSTMLKGWGEVKGTENEGYTFSLAMVLMILVLVVFFIMKVFVKQTDTKVIEKKQTKETQKIKKLDKKIKNYGVAELSLNDQYAWYKISEIRRQNKLNRIKEREDLYIYKTVTNTTAKTHHSEKYKKRKSFNFSILSFTLSLIGIFSFISIITYLLVGGVNYLSWDFLTTKGVYETPIGGPEIMGLAVPLFGTIITIITAFLFVIPLGLFGGIYFGEYSSGGKISNLLLSGIELLASIPSLIMGLIGIILFVPIADFLNYIPLAGALILTFITLPTVIKTTEESIKSVAKTKKEASLALGATKSTTSWKIAIPEAMPGILSGYILSAGRMLGESAALIIIWGSFSRTSEISWLQNGGTTLATEIYRLTGDAAVIPWNAIKAIGIVIMFVIFGLSVGANAIKENRKYEAIIIFLSLLGMFLGIQFNLFIFFNFSFVLIILGLFSSGIRWMNNYISRKFKINLIPLKVQYWYRTKIGK